MYCLAARLRGDGEVLLSVNKSYLCVPWLFVQLLITLPASPLHSLPSHQPRIRSFNWLQRLKMMNNLGLLVLSLVCTLVLALLMFTSLAISPYLSFSFLSSSFPWCFAQYTSFIHMHSTNLHFSFAMSFSFFFIFINTTCFTLSVSSYVSTKLIINVQHKVGLYCFVANFDEPIAIRVLKLTTLS